MDPRNSATPNLPAVETGVRNAGRRLPRRPRESARTGRTRASRLTAQPRKGLRQSTIGLLAVYKQIVEADDVEFRSTQRGQDAGHSYPRAGGARGGDALRVARARSSVSPGCFVRSDPEIHAREVRVRGWLEVEPGQRR